MLSAPASSVCSVWHVDGQVLQRRRHCWFPAGRGGKSRVRQGVLRRQPGAGKDRGQELLSYGNEKPAHIIGLLDDERQASVVEQSQPEIEVCIPQITPDSGFYRVAEGLAMNLAVRTERSPGSFVPELREVLRSASPELAGTTFTTMAQVLDDSYGDQRITARLLQIFAGSALLLCITGLYSLLAYLVTQRTQELGIRFALGAQRQQVIWRAASVDPMQALRTE